MNNVVPIKPVSQQWLVRAMTQQANGETVNPNEFWSVIDFNEDNKATVDWLISQKLIAKNEYAKRKASHERRNAVINVLGFYPETALDFALSYATTNGITITKEGLLHRRDPEVKLDGLVIREDIEPTYYRIGAKLAIKNVLQYKNELICKRIELNLPFTDSDISNSVDHWFELTQTEAINKALFSVSFNPTAQMDQHWTRLEAECFEVEETGFAVAAIKKFIWQVKRKANGLPVTHHLMPVITGVQGKGKSKFVEALIGPLDRVSKTTDFRAVTEDRNIDLWNNYILFFDEMGFASKADVDTIKNVITSSTLSRRPMRSNATQTVAQNATFIGCSNKSLAELIWDTTGVRRFVELQWSSGSELNNWAAVNEPDWQDMWQSVDENGPDPMLPFLTKLIEQQSENRNKSPIELWVLENAQRFQKAGGTLATDLYSPYRDWEKDNFPRHDTSVQQFGRMLGSLAVNNPELLLTKRRTKSGFSYEISKESAQ